MTHQQGNLEIAPAVRVLVLLFADVGTDLLQLKSHRGHRVPPRPKVLARKVALLPAKLSGNGSGTLPLQEADHVRHCILGGNGDTHRDVIGHDMPLDNLTLFLARQRMEDRSQLPSHLAIQLPSPSFRDKNYVILALPAGMRQALIAVFHDVLLWLPHQAPAGGLLLDRSNLFKSHWSNQWLTLLLQLKLNGEQWDEGFSSLITIADRLAL